MILPLQPASADAYAFSGSILPEAGKERKRTLALQLKYGRRRCLSAATTF